MQYYHSIIISISLQLVYIGKKYWIHWGFQVDLQTSSQ